MNRITLALFAMAAMIATSVASAETVYIKEDWRIGFYTEPDSNSAGIGLLRMGQALEVVEIGPDYSKIRTENGSEGWVDNRYIVETPTVVQQLAERERQIERLEDQVETLASDSGEDQWQAALKEERLARETAQEKLEAVSRENQKLREQLDPDARLEATITAITLCLVGLVVGFVVGRRVMEAKVRARFHGMKVW